MYDPIIGRFYQEDPIWPEPGEANPFLYTNNSPTNATDPSGLWLIIPNEQQWIWEAIRDEGGVDIQFKPYLDYQIVVAARDHNTHNKLYSILPKLGVDKAGTTAAINALYGGSLSAPWDDKSSPPGDMTKFGGNMQIWLTPPQIVGAIPMAQNPVEPKFRNQVEKVEGFEPTSEPGVWVAPPAKPGGRTLYLVRPTETAEFGYLVSGWQGRAFKFEVYQPLDKSSVQADKLILSNLDGKFTPTLGPQKHDAIREQFGREALLEGFLFGVDVYSGKGLVKGGAALGKASLSALFKSEGRFASAMKSAVSSTGSTRVPGPAFTEKQISELTTDVLNWSKQKVTVKVDPKFLDSVPDKPAAAFYAPPGKQAIIYLRENPTVYEFAHEYGHAQHWMKWQARPSSVVWKDVHEMTKEITVFNYLREPMIWRYLTVEQRQDAINVLRLYAIKNGHTAKDPVGRRVLELIEDAKKEVNIPREIPK